MIKLCTHDMKQGNKLLKSQVCHLKQLLFELLCVMREIRHSVHHLLDGARVWVVQRGRFSRSDHRFQQVTQHVAGVHHPVSYLGGLRLPGQRVPDEDQFVSAEDDKLAVSDEDARRLPGAHAAEEGVDGAQERDEMLLALLRVEGEELAVSGANVRGGGHGGGGGGGVGGRGGGHARVLV